MLIGENIAENTVRQICCLSFLTVVLLLTFCCNCLSDGFAVYWSGLIKLMLHIKIANKSVS